MAVETLSGFSPTVFALIGLLVGLLVFSIIQLLKIGTRPAGLPPGPRTEPILGNLRQVDWQCPHKQLTEWSKQYGPVYSIMQGAIPAVVISGHAEAVELFTKQGQYTVGRPDLPHYLAIRNGYSPFLMNGSKWRSARKLWHAALNVSASKQFLAYQTLEVKHLMHDLLEDGGKSGMSGTWTRFFERYSNSVAMTLVNGHRVLDSSDPVIRETCEDLLELTRLSPQCTFLDSYPFLQKLPNWVFPIMKKAKRAADSHEAIIMRWYNTVREDAKLGGSGRLSSFNNTVQEKLSEGWEGVTDVEGAEISQTLLDAATDTTSCILFNLVAALALYPRVQKKAQEEIDRVIGRSRLPFEKDLLHLPYVSQTLLELQRWLTVVPLCLPHATTQDLPFGPYTIPKGTTLHLNAWAIHSDPDLYPEPELFKPERWEGKLDPETFQVEDGLWTFGAGRRICPGQHLAQRSVYLALTHLVWGFDVRPAKDGEGREVGIDLGDLRLGPITGLKEFAVDIRVRDEGKAGVVRGVWEECWEKDLTGEGQWRKGAEGLRR